MLNQTSELHNYFFEFQVHPYKLCHAFYEKAKELVGSELKIAKVTGFEKEGNKVTGVQLNSSEVIPADVVVLAMGPWSNQLAKFFTIPKVQISNTPYQSYREDLDVFISGWWNHSEIFGDEQN